MRFAVIITLIFSITAFGGQILSQQDVDIQSFMAAHNLNKGDEPVISTTEYVNAWYGKVCPGNLPAYIDDDLTVDVYMQTSTNAYVAALLLVLATDTTYIDTMYGAAEATLHYPFTEWDFTWLSDPIDQPAGWQSQSFLGFPNVYEPYYGDPWLHFETPTKVLELVVHTVNDSSLIGQTVTALGEGVDPYQGSSNASDTTGMVTYWINESFSNVRFRPCHNGWSIDGSSRAEADENDELVKGDFGGSSIPTDYGISQNYPNPFNATTSIDYSLPQDSHVSIKLYNVLGKEVAVLLNQYETAGYHNLTWDAGAVSSGMYFYRIETDGFAQTKKMTLLK